ncbi:MAG: peptidase T [Planctomycetia bacterium]|nr:peptidase T [Planctomycetia bacterium]
MSTERLTERFLRYVKIDTRTEEGATEYPGSVGQRELGDLLVKELRAIGLADASADPFGIVTATLPARGGRRYEKAPMISWIAHLDTSPDAPGRDVNPMIIRNYDGQPITLPGRPSAGFPERTLDATRHPELSEMNGCTLIVTDGTTLLGADDKGGVAIIMEAVERLVEDPIPHGPIRVCFTCDEEIGRGTDHVDPSLLGVAAYTVDGDAGGQLNMETFSAAMATVTVDGVNCHPGTAKGFMVNAVRVLSRYVELLPRVISAEMTDGEEGFLHPLEIHGDPGRAVTKILIRDFETSMIPKRTKFLRELASLCELEYPGATIRVNVKKQYRNMRDGLVADPRSVRIADQALRKLGRDPLYRKIRGGTDGSRLTELGVPTPNLSAGGHCMHSVEEWACVEEMELSVEWLREIARLWGREVA